MKPVVPEWFEEQLEREFRGELRLRWSEQRKEWHIEQRVGRAALSPPKRWDPHSDRLVRARDGYHFFGAIQPRTTRTCPSCKWPIQVPELTFKEAQCGYCGYKGLSGRMVLAYFPLGWQLIDWLKKHDPTRDHMKRTLKEIDLHNERVELEKEGRAEEERQDVLTDILLDQIPTFGYTGGAKV